MAAAKNFISDLLNIAGITINGKNPWDIQVNDNRLYQRILKNGSLGLGESYMECWWECEQLDQFFTKVLSAQLDTKISQNPRLFLKLLFLKSINRQSKKRALMVGKKHYDLGNDLFKHVLDERMNYTCGYWENVDNLNGAQHQKLALTASKLMLKPGMRVLDIGCGFGALAKYLAQEHRVSVVGVSISKEQVRYAKNNCMGLPVDIRFQDYRDVTEKFDRVVSLGMFEHVGHRNYHAYMRQVKQNLKEDGLFLLHTIGVDKNSNGSDPWLNKYIFPNGELPSATKIAKATQGIFVMENWHNFGADYDKTLLAWHDNFLQHWDQLKSKYDEQFYRMWRYYLLSCAGMFRARKAQLWQIVFSYNGLQGGYHIPHYKTIFDEIPRDQ